MSYNNSALNNVERRKNMIIAIEGGEGAGKSTIVNQLKEVLDDNYIFVAEPGSTQTALEIRQEIFDHPEYSEVKKAQLFAIARKSLNHEIVLPALKEGKNIISDRTIISSLMYQSLSEELSVQEVLEINKVIDPELSFPNKAIYLDIDPVYAMNRISNNNRETNYMDFDSLDNKFKLREKFISYISGMDQNLIVDSVKLQDNPDEFKKIVEFITK